MEPLEEALRLEAQKITDTGRDENFDRIVRLACTTMETPVATISFVDSERQWFKARQGLDVAETARDISFCTHAIESNDVMVVEDARKDPRFAANPLVTCKKGIRFYAGAPLRTREGFNLGTLCVIDHKPHKVNRRDTDLLKDMAAIVVQEMELRKRAGTDTLTGLYNRRLIDEICRA